MTESWMSEALCRHFPTPTWIVEPEGRTPASTAALTAVCLSCPVRPACAGYVLRKGIVSGFWAGTDRSPSKVIDRADGAA